LDDHEVAAVQGGSGGQVAGGGVDGDQPLGAVQEGGAGEDGGQHQAGTEGGAGVHPAGRAQALGRRPVGREDNWVIRMKMEDLGGKRAF
jgi:hypothetical protein